MTQPTVTDVTVVGAGHRMGSLATLQVAASDLTFTFAPDGSRLDVALSSVERVGRNGPTMMTVFRTDGSAPKRLTVYFYDRGAVRHGRALGDAELARRRADTVVAALESRGVRTERPGTTGNIVGWGIVLVLLAALVVPVALTGSAATAVPAVVVGGLAGLITALHRRRLR